MLRIYTVAKWQRQLLGCPLHSRASYRKKSIFLGHPENIRFNQSPPSHAVVSFSSRRRNSANTRPHLRKYTRESGCCDFKGLCCMQKTLSHKNLEEDDDIDEDAFEALFSQLEEDLKNDGLIAEDGEDDFLSEEELAKLEHELAEALEEDELLGALGSMAYGDNNNDYVEEESDNVDDYEAGDEEEEIPDKAQELAIQEIGLCSENWSAED